MWVRRRRTSPSSNASWKGRAPQGSKRLRTYEAVAAEGRTAQRVLGWVSHASLDISQLTS
jgi:hypothetical protein